MTYITYSQPKLKNQFDRRIRDVMNIVKTRSTPDLWVKVFIKRNNVWWLRLKEKDEPQVQFFFGDRYDLQDIKKQLYYVVTGHWGGHYRYAEVFGHGFYDEEWKFIRKHPKIKHVITLKLAEGSSDLDIAKLFAHEFRHYLQYKKYGSAMTRFGNSGRRTRPVQVERDANRWAKKRIEKLLKEGQLYAD